jgi:hypothetical protein
MSQKMYDDVYVRSNLSENGMYPATGAWTQSPDIIPNGTNVIADPVKSLTDSYSKDVGKETVLNQQNYYYIRAKNLYNGARTAKFELYYCPSNIFMFPSLWVDNQLETSGGEKQVSASVNALNDIVVPTSAFTNVPKSSVHHCMVGRVITDSHPNPLPASGTITDMTSLGKFILDHPGFCWRNIVLVNKDVPTFTHSFDFDTGATGGEILMGMNCKNITKGSYVAFSCGDPIPSGPDKGAVIQLVKTEVTQSNMFLGQMKLDVPANFKTNVSYTYWAKTPIQSGWEAEFTAILVTPPGHELYERARPVHEYGFDKRSDGYGGIQRGVQIGACSTQGK